MAIDFSSLYDIPREFEQLWDRMARGGRVFRQKVDYPLVNIMENDEGYLFEVSIPGVDPEDINLEISQGNISISGERKAPEGKYYRQERGLGYFQRVFSLNAPIDRDKATAEFKDGMLKIHMPKAAASRPLKISINADA